MSTILNVGDDPCYRIPVMERAGLIVVRTQCSVGALEDAFAVGTIFSAITFHTEVDGPVQAAVSSARRLCEAPLILFQNSSTRCDENLFDLIIPAQTPPALWLKSLQEAILKAHNIHKKSDQLQKDCASLRSASRELRRKSAQIRENLVDIDAFWRDPSNSGEEK